jgi:hypothetical protein
MPVGSSIQFFMCMCRCSFAGGSDCTVRAATAAFGLTARVDATIAFVVTKQRPATSASVGTDLGRMGIRSLDMNVSLRARGPAGRKLTRAHGSPGPEGGSDLRLWRDGLGPP